MTNREVIEHFVNGTKNGAKANSVRISGDGLTLFSYGTAIAQKAANDTIIVNETKYSATTSKHQCYLRYEVHGKRTRHVDGVPMWTVDLTRYLRCKK